MSGLETVLAAMVGVQTLSAMVSSLPVPKTEGFYSFVYKFLHMEMNILSEYVQKRFNLPDPVVQQETAVTSVSTPSSQTEIAVSKTTTTLPQTFQEK